MEELKRLFLAMEVVAPWPEKLPPGRILSEENRHLTLAFLGDTQLPAFRQLLLMFPKPPFQTGLAGIFDSEVFLPHHSPRVVAYHLHCLELKRRFFNTKKRFSLVKGKWNARQKRSDFWRM